MRNPQGPSVRSISHRPHIDCDSIAWAAAAKSSGFKGTVSACRLGLRGALRQCLMLTVLLFGAACSPMPDAPVVDTGDGSGTGDGAECGCMGDIRVPPTDLPEVPLVSGTYTPTQYLHIEEFDIHILGTPSVSEWMMREGCEVVENMVRALKAAEDRAKMAGHLAYFITNDDPSVGYIPGHRNTGGDGFSLFSEELVCATAADTLYPNGAGSYRAWNTPVHEFGHAIEITLGLQARSDAVYSANANDYNSSQRREYIAWGTQEWFASAADPKWTRETMHDWEFEYMATIFDVENAWVPKCTR